VGLNVRFTAFSPLKSVADTDLYGYQEEVFFEMTDVEKNMDTKRWPSKENIVSFSPSRGDHNYV